VDWVTDNLKGFQADSRGGMKLSTWILIVTMIIIILFSGTGFYLMETGNKCVVSPQKHGIWCRFRKCNKALSLCHKADGKLDTIFLSIITLSTIGYDELTCLTGADRELQKTLSVVGLGIFTDLKVESGRY
jgi:hypothetical protein